MRPRLVHGLAAMAAVAVACSNNPKPQEPISSPEPQPAGVTLENPPGKPFNEPSVQQPAMETPPPQQPITQPEPQKPFYGPGLTSPDEKAEEQAKAKQPVKSDGEALGVMMAIDDGEVQMAELAKKHAESADVKQFAGMLSTQHQQAMGKLRNLQGKTKIELKDSDAASMIKGDFSQDMTALRDKKGKEFDRLFMDAQVRMHKESIDVIDNRVLPGVTNGQLKASIDASRRQMSDHLAKAESIVKKLEPSTTAARTDEKGTSGTKTDTAKGKTDADETSKEKKDSGAKP